MARTDWSGSLASLRCSVFSISSPIPLAITLVIASGVSLAFGEHVVGLIIIALFSVLLNFLMEFQARHAVEVIRKQIAIIAAVMRGG